MKEKHISIIILLIGLALSLVACDDSDEIVEDILDDNIEQDKDISEKIAEMTLDEKIGQLMIIGYEGSEMDEYLDKSLKELKPSGIISFNKNILDWKQTLDHLNAIKRQNKIYGGIPLFISLDEEGGMVSRLPEDMIKTVDAQSIGKTKDADLIQAIGSRVGKNIDYLGFNMNFAPVLDIKINPNNKSIGTRAFGNDRDTVSFAGLNFMKGLKEENIISVVKHFPGLGDTETDSHFKLPIVRKSLEDLEEMEMQPFFQAIDQNVDGIMIGHIAFPEIDNQAATMSRVIIYDLLRDKYDYEGVIISDDMTMGAITNSHEPEEAALRFIEAGGDLALLAHGQEIGYNFREKIKIAIDEGRISKESIDNKVYRILKLKKKYELNDNMAEYVNLTEVNLKTKRLNEEILENLDKQQKIKKGSDRKDD